MRVYESQDQTQNQQQRTLTKSEAARRQTVQSVEESNSFVSSIEYTKRAEDTLKPRVEEVWLEAVRRE